mmetsp:Transcript_12473/g.14340  ORF Transcript_12473/g.14340 Transcript_12473/m.14340 type:complete len:883 (+) Transcript_12473:111-2759(+)|eukprot:CAMPEP_0184011270 /NCGR_PEP_ID=MMETSP0954-20121128/3731_1 /TAXON_ID=627963 /ORGANISM="Aplanochytrium sp, Strain PBS07" /LENGTH=882 /DNA_ID=CAMNT_0026291063 /DNA_START=59 /DNA_END=2707 /DNA_ORIENTATION=+
MANSQTDRVVLSDQVIPSHYDISITPNLSGDFKFQASVKIHFEVKAPTLKSISLHCWELDLLSASYSPENGKAFDSNGFDFDENLKTVTVKFGPELPVGNGVLSIEYLGLHNNQMAGFYRSVYNDENGEEKVLVSTQFEPLDARRCFPCVDEPGRKATFKCSLVVDENLTALSNMPEEKVTSLPEGKKKVDFEVSPRMSTYLLAFMVGEFDYIETKSDHGVLIRVYVPPGKQHLGEFSLDVAKRSLDIYDDLFGQPYPLPKLDMIGAPEFSHGAMENWGLVIYRMVDLLIDPVRASSSQKQRVGEVVAHELAHQWFGNLVTMEWWDDLWLNEGFASFMQKYSMDSIFPDFSMWEQFIVSDQSSALKLDALSSSHPIQVPIKHAEEVEEIFDMISYCKGASVVRMIFAYLGEGDFMKGLQSYMKKFAYQNTRTIDLWRSWEEVSNKPISKVMASWTEQMGFPVITVTNASWNSKKESCELTLDQSWFLSDGSTPPDGDAKQWVIPLIASTATGEQSLGLFDKKSQSFTVSTKGSSWLKLNGGQHVPLRVRYTEDLLDRLKEPILKLEMSAEDRIGTVLDAFSLCKAGSLDAEALIKIIGAYKNETEYPVWEAVGNVIGEISMTLRDDSDLYSQFVNFVSDLVQIPAREIGWDNRDDDGHLGKLKRQVLIGLQAMCSAEDKKLIKEATNRFEQYVSCSDPAAAAKILPAEIKSSVFQIVLSNATDNSALEKMIELANAESDAAERKIIFLSIGSAHSAELKERVLEWSVSGQVKLQDFFYPMSSVSNSSYEGAEIAWTFLKQNFDKIRGMVELPNIVMAVVAACSSGFASDQHADDMERFFKDVNTTGLDRKIQQIVGKTRASAKLKTTLQSSTGFKSYLRQFS